MRILIWPIGMLYLIEILHQTTTLQLLILLLLRCILSKFYIKPQLSSYPAPVLGVVSYRNSTSNHNASPPIIWTIKLYLIEILHQTTTESEIRKVNLALYLIEILHQTTTHYPRLFELSSCILSKFYIKPQLARQWLMVPCVVSYRNSTSNHNFRCWRECYDVLYLIEILHQTTTSGVGVNATMCCILSKFYIKPQRASSSFSRFSRCILSKFYIKPQHLNWDAVIDVRCILSKFYIKPQHPALKIDLVQVVSYRNSTSNHNDDSKGLQNSMLYLIEILHQTTTFWKSSWISEGCILSKFYIKPQHVRDGGWAHAVVSYRNSTSNHNSTT